MVTIVESPKLATREEAEQRKLIYSGDGVPVEIVENDDGTFTVRATYQDGDVPPELRK